MCSYTVYSYKKLGILNTFLPSIRLSWLFQPSLLHFWIHVSFYYSLATDSLEPKQYRWNRWEIQRNVSQSIPLVSSARRLLIIHFEMMLLHVWRGCGLWRNHESAVFLVYVGPSSEMQWRRLLSRWLRRIRSQTSRCL